MITYFDSSIFTSTAPVLVNPVNTVGVMGAGLALEFKQRYPKMFLEYHAACARGDIQIGKLFFWSDYPVSVLCFPTKTDWRCNSQMFYVERGLIEFVHLYHSLGISHIAFPRLGCGHGGLSWNAMRQVMEKYLAPLPIKVDVHLF